MTAVTDETGGPDGGAPLEGVVFVRRDLGFTADRSPAVAMRASVGEIAQVPDPLVHRPVVRANAPKVVGVRSPALLARVALIAALAAPVVAADAQSAARCEPADRVRSVHIEGSLIATDELQLVLATQTPSLSWRLLRLGAAPCADSTDIAQDALRIAVLHRQRGWFRAQVSAAADRSDNGTRVRFRVDPGPLARVRAVLVHGLAPIDSAALVGPLTSLPGSVFDRVRVQAAADRVLLGLRDAGYARAALRRSDVQIDSTAAEVDLDFTFDAGARFRLGTVTVEVEPVRGRSPRYSNDEVRALAGLTPGTSYRASDVLAAQSALYRTDAFRLVLIDTVAVPTSPADSLADSAATLDVRIRLADARTRSARVGAGWGTLECGRVQGRVTDRGFLGPGRRVELTARASRIGIGRPLDQFPGLCPQFLRDDPYSQELNYYLGVTLGNSTFFGLPVAPSLDVYSERRGEFNAFQLETDIGIGFSLSRAVSRRTLVGGGIEFESGRIVTDAVLACVRFALCQPSDFALARQGNTTQAVNLTWLHDRTVGVADPRDGGRLRTDVRVGQTSFPREALGQTGTTRRRYDFVRPTLEAAGFTRLAGGTLAARVQWAQVYAPNAFSVGGVSFLPPQERLFSGGQNTVRGFQQNLLGPVVYRVERAGVDSVPLNGSYQLVVRPDATVRLPSPEGGSASLVTNLEYRRRFAWPTQDVQWALFLDAGTVWADGVASFALREVRATPGLGVRLDTPLGPFRVDIGYNPRRAEAGKAFLFDSFARDGGAATPFVVCVSPGQTLTFAEQLAAGGLDCPRSFRPASGRSTLSRLVFHFSLGQAF